MLHCCNHRKNWLPETHLIYNLYKKANTPFCAIAIQKNRQIMQFFSSVQLTPAWVHYLCWMLSTYAHSLLMQCCNACTRERETKRLPSLFFPLHQWINKYNWTLSATKLTGWWELYANWTNQLPAFHCLTPLSAHKYTRKHDHKVQGWQSIGPTSK